MVLMGMRTEQWRRWQKLHTLRMGTRMPLTMGTLTNLQRQVLLTQQQKQHRGPLLPSTIMTTATMPTISKDTNNKLS